MSCNCNCNHGGYVKSSNREITGYIYVTGPQPNSVSSDICYIGYNTTLSLNWLQGFEPLYNPAIPPVFPDPAYPNSPASMQINGVSAFNPGFVTGGSVKYVFPNLSSSLPLLSWSMGIRIPPSFGPFGWFIDGNITKKTAPCSPLDPQALDDYDIVGPITFGTNNIKFIIPFYVEEVLFYGPYRRFYKKIVELDLINPFWPNVVSGSVSFDVSSVLSSGQVFQYTDIPDLMSQVTIHYAFSLWNRNRPYEKIRGCCNWISPTNDPPDPAPPVDPEPEPPSEDPDCCTYSRWVCINNDSRLLSLDTGDETWDVSDCCLSCTSATVRLKFTCVDGVISLQQTYTCDSESSIETRTLNFLCDDESPFQFFISTLECAIPVIISAADLPCDPCEACCNETRWYCINGISKEMTLVGDSDTFDVTDCCDCETSILTLEVECLSQTNTIRYGWSITCGESIEPSYGVEFLSCDATVLNITVNECFYQIQISTTNVGCEECGGGITTTTPPPL